MPGGVSLTHLRGNTSHPTLAEPSAGEAIP